MLDRVDDTIVARSSAPGSSPVGIVRLSGPDAMTIADAVAIGANDRPLSRLPGSTRTFGHVLVGETGRIPADFYLFRTPRSYTRQDMVEIHAPGSPATLEFIRKLCLDRGARPAEPGEFTARAFLNGRIDLARAEGVCGMIRAESDTQLRASRRMMEGDLSQAIETTRDRLSELLALVEADIDFSEEPIDFITPGELRDRLEEVSGRLARWLGGSVCVERFDALPRILLFGPPNVGKSSLMNRLCGTSRAICAAVAGTTRDILSAPIALGSTSAGAIASSQGEAILLDTAGVDRSENEIIAQARELTLSTAQRVDLVCIVVDLSAPRAEDLRGTLDSLSLPRVVIAGNKRDLVNDADAAAKTSMLRDWNLGLVHEVSAETGAGIDELRAGFAGALSGQTVTTFGEAIIISERQRHAVTHARDAIARGVQLAVSAEETIDCADLLAFELREALDQLGTVTGSVTTTDLLRQVFARFCIGK